jgi:hypothetical protein
MADRPDPLAQLVGFPLLDAIFGRRSRRFGLGMQIPSGPLAYTSDADPQPLSELERSMLVAAGTGVSGWHFGIPFGPDRPDAHAHYSQRLTGRTAPTAAGFGTPMLFFTDDDGTYLTDTRDVEPSSLQEVDGSPGSLADALAVCREHTVTLSDRRLDLPAQPPHMLPPNLWMANAAGSTVFMPVADASEEVLGLLAMTIANGGLPVDAEAARPAGDLAPFVRSGLLDEDKKTPIQVVQQIAYEACCSEVAFMAHNIVLTLQAMGLGGLFLSGLNRWSVLGAFAQQGIAGLGFRFVDVPGSPMPNPVGLDGHFEGLCPPYHGDMAGAVAAFVERKFGAGGTYDPSIPGPWQDSAAMKRGVEPYSDEFVACLTEVAQYVYDTKGRFPDTFTTMVLTGYVQAVHLDTGFYDTHYRAGAYLDSHAEHQQRWHEEQSDGDAQHASSNWRSG